MSDLQPASTGFFQPDFGSDYQSESIPAITATIAAQHELALSDELQDEIAATEAASRAENTQRNYKLAAQQFDAWCIAQGRRSLPASVETLKGYLNDLAKTHKVSTVKVRLAAIAHLHRAAGHPFDRKALTFTLDGLAAKKGTIVDKADAVSLDMIRAALAELPETASGARDRALLLVGFWGALRRSEIVAIDVAHAEVLSQGIRLTIPRSKTDQHGAGQVIGLPRRGDDLCPVAAFQAWLAVSGIREGAVFVGIRKGGMIADRLTAQSVSLILQKRTGRDDLSAHGLRSGFVTEAARKNVTAATIRKTTRHTNDKQVEGYIRDARLFDDLAHKAMG